MGTVRARGFSGGRALRSFLVARLSSPHALPARRDLLRFRETAKRVVLTDTHCIADDACRLPEFKVAHSRFQVSAGAVAFRTKLTSAMALARPPRAFTERRGS